MKIFRITLFVILALAIALVSTQVLASPAQAPAAQGNNSTKTPGAQATQKAIERATQGVGKPKGKPENYKGTVEAVDATSLTLKLRDETTVVIALGPETQIKFPGRKDLAPAAIEAGMQVHVQALRDDAGNLTARRVMVIPGKPQKIHRVGIVTAYTAESITIQDKKGETFIFELAADTVILPAERAGELAVGSRVTIIAPRDPATGGVRVRGIVVHPTVTQ
jgi:hypothetical protein